jgi:rubrerythrin
MSQSHRNDIGTPDPSIKTTREMLTLAETMHRKLKRHYADVAQTVAEPDAAMLLDYLSRKEATFQSMLAEYRRQAPDAVLDTYFQFTQTEYRSIEKWTTWQPDAGVGIPGILAAALELDSCMQAFYRRAAEMAQIPEVRKMFTNLVEAVAAKKRDAALNTALMKDV